MNNKKAVSAIIATVLLVLITIAAIGVLWGAIIPMIKDPIEKAQLCSDVVEVTGASTSDVSVAVKKDGVQQYVANVFDISGKSLTTCPKIGPWTAGSVVTCTYAAQPNAVKVNVVATVKLANGKNDTCPTVEAAIGA